MADLKRRIVAEFSAKNKAKGVMSGFGRDMDTVGRTMRRMAVGALAVAGVGGLGYMLKRQMEAIDATAKLSDRLGIATEALVGLQHGASIAGVEQETLNKSLEIFSRRLGEVDMGIGQATYALDKLGLNYKDLIGLDMDKAFAVIADQVNQLSTQSEKAAAANYLFGRSGQQLLNLFEEGSAGIEDFRKEAEKLGLTFDRIDAAKVEAANDALTRARAVMTGLFRQATIQLSPYIEVLADKFVDVATAGEGVGANVVDVFEKMSLAALKFGELINSLPAYWKASEAAARESLATIYDIADAATNLDVLFKKLRLPKWEYTYKELAEQQRQIAAELYEAGGADLAAAMQKQSAVEKWFDDLRKKAAGQREALETKARQRAEISVDAGPVEEQTKVVISAEQKKMQALEKSVDVEIELLGRLNEPRQHARQLIQYEAAAMEVFAGNAQEAAAATEVFRDKLEELEEAQKWAEVAKTMEQSFAGALERLSQDWRNYGDVAKGVLREILMEIMRIMVWRPAAQAGASWIQMGLSALGDLITGGGGETTGARMEAIAKPGYYGHEGIPAGYFPPRLHRGMKGGLKTDEFLAVIQRGETEIIPRGEAGPPSFTFVVENQTGTPMKMEKQRQGTNPREFIITVVADDAAHGGVLADVFQTRQG